MSPVGPDDDTCDQIIREKRLRKYCKYNLYGTVVMIKKLNGIAHGKTIELAEDSGLVDGQEVEVLITIAAARAKSGSGFRSTEGALADDDQWDAIMDEIHQARGNDSRSIAAELE